MSSNPSATIFRYVWVSAWYAFAAVMVLLATSFAAARLLLPYAEQYNAELGDRFGEYLDQPVLVESLDAEWHGWGPSLVLRDVALLDRTSEQPVLKLDKIRLGLDLLASLRQWQLSFSNITLVGVDLFLARNAQGQLSVAGFSGQVENSAMQPDATLPFASWLFSQAQLSLEDSNITWYDEMGAGRSMHFSGVNLSLQNDGDQHQLDAFVSLSRDLGKSLSLRVDMRGDPLSLKGRHTQMYVAGEHVRLAELIEPQAFGGVDVSIKSAGFEVWGQWKEGVLQQLKGDVEAGGLSMRSKTQANPAQTLLLDRMAGYFSWQRTEDGWSFDGDELMLARKSRQWQPARMSLNYSQKKDAQQKNTLPTINASVSYLQLEDISELLSLFEVGGDDLQQPLQAIRPRGEIKNARLHWRGGERPDYQAYAMLRSATVNAWRNIPSAVDVDGQLWLGSTGGQVAVQHAAVTLDFPSLFRWPLQVDEFRGHVAWEYGNGEWRVAGRNLEARNQDVTASATLDVIQGNTHDTPFMSLVVDYEDGDGSQVAHYLPTGIMSEAAVDWLDEAFVSARITSGGSVFHGYLEDFPFKDRNGKFEVRFSVDNASLNYADAWPPITGINADVQFEGSGMFVDVHRGNIYSNQIRWAKVGIADMAAKPMMLTVDGEVRGDTQEKLDYLVASPPLNAAFAKRLENMTATGDSVLQLDLDLPIGGGEDDVVLVKGGVSLKENTLSIPSLERVLSEVDGRLNFSQDGLQAENIQAELLGQSTQINIVTEESGTARNVRIKAGGLFDAPDLAAHYVPALEDLLTGGGEWNVVFDIPMSEKEKVSTSELSPSEQPNEQKDERPATMYVQTNLKGVEARLPPPFNKDADETGSLELRIYFLPEQAPVMRVNYAGFADSIFTLNDAETAEEFRAELRFNAGTAVLPDAPGLHVKGWLDKVSLDEWRYFFSLSGAQADKQQASASNANQNLAEESEFVVRGEDALAVENGVPLLASADVAVRLFEAYGQQLHNARLKAIAENTSLSAEFEAKELKGHLTIPYDRQKHPVAIDLSHLYLTKPESGEGVVDPRGVPALDVRVDDFRYEKRHFGKVRLETTRVAEGVRIEQLILQPKSTTMTARGGWYVRGEQQQSNVTMHLESSNIGRTLKALDYVGGIDKGKGTADLELTWPGSFVEVDASKVRGKFKMSLKDGYVLDVDPGAGRMFGMLSIQALPRRLLLDFSDVFKEGFGFDRLKGNFSIEDGDAYTNNLYMVGPAARVEIAGRTGLAQQDYDQLVTVTPHVGETLPVLGMLTATPQVGAVVLAIQKLFKPAIDDVTRTQYSITGEWNAPVITKIKPEKPIADAVDEDG